MNVAIICGSVQKNSGSRRNAELLKRTIGKDASIVDLSPFTELFTGEYVDEAHVSDQQRAALRTMREAGVLLFVVPTYFKSLPGALKNFFDIVRQKSLYAHKVIGFMASNHKNQDFGAREAQKILMGIIAFFDAEAAFVPEIVISDPEAPSPEAATRLVMRAQQLRQSYRR